MAKDIDRTDIIISQLELAVKACRRVLIVGDRLYLLGVLYRLMREYFPSVTLGVYTGDWWRDVNQLKAGRKYKRRLKQEEKDAAESAQVIFSTKQTVEEGLDIWDRDCLFLISPLSDPEQAVGRVRRAVPPHLEIQGVKKPIPKVVDFVDSYPQMRGMYRKRARWYLENGASIE